MSLTRSMKVAISEAVAKKVVAAAEVDPDATPETTGEVEYDNPTADVGLAMKSVLRSLNGMAGDLSKSITKTLAGNPTLDDLQHGIEKAVSIVLAMFDFLEANLPEAEEDDEDYVYEEPPEEEEEDEE